jgi:hypothetical protein
MGVLACEIQAKKDITVFHEKKEKHQVNILIYNMLMVWSAICILSRVWPIKCILDHKLSTICYIVLLYQYLHTALGKKHATTPTVVGKSIISCNTSVTPL